MAEVQIPMSLGNRIIFVKNVKAKTVIPPRSDAMSPADYANRFQKAGNRVGPRRSSPRRRSHSATRSGHVPTASRTDRLPDRHARSLSASCRGAHGSKTDDRSADRAAAPPEPAATGSRISRDMNVSPIAPPARKTKTDALQEFSRQYYVEVADRGVPRIARRLLRRG